MRSLTLARPSGLRASSTKYDELRAWASTEHRAAVIDVRPEHHVAYNVSKAGVAHLSRMLASEWAESGVRVNAVGPGFVATEMLTEDRSLRQFWKAQIPLERFLEPYEIANAIAFLATDAASAITGNHILADGGVTIR